MSREIDFLIAEHLFGWTWGEGMLYESRGLVLGPKEFSERPMRSLLTPEGKLGSVPHFSSDIAEAWKITTKICNTWYIRWHDAYSEWHVKCDHKRVVDDDCRFEAWATDAPEAICVAALRSQGISPPEEFGDFR